MIPTPLLERDRFFVMKTNDTFQSYNSLDDCFEQSDIRFVIYDKYKQKAPSGRRMSDFILYSKDKSETTIASNGWSIAEINMTNRSKNFIFIVLTILDPLKITRLISVCP